MVIKNQAFSLDKRETPWYIITIERGYQIPKRGDLIV